MGSVLMARVIRQAQPFARSSCCEKAIHIERVVLFEHEVRRTAEPGGEDAERLALAVATFETLLVLPASRVPVQEADSRFREGPFEVSAVR
jgi:hypothetical protein